MLTRRLCDVRGNRGVIKSIVCCKCRIFFGHCGGLLALSMRLECSPLSSLEFAEKKQKQRNLYSAVNRSQNRANNAHVNTAALIIVIVALLLLLDGVLDIEGELEGADGEVFDEGVTKTLGEVSLPEEECQK